MALFSALELASRLTQEERLDAGLPLLPDRPKRHELSTPEFWQWLREEIEQEERDLNAGRVAFPVERERTRYGAQRGRSWSTTDAIRSWALRHLRDRLLRRPALLYPGDVPLLQAIAPSESLRARLADTSPQLTPDDVQALVEAVAASPAFRARVNGWKVTLSEVRRPSSPQFD